MSRGNFYPRQTDVSLGPLGSGLMRVSWNAFFPEIHTMQSRQITFHHFIFRILFGIFCIVDINTKFWHNYFVEFW